ncbi:MAG: c-type cytochrome [Vicinamibacteria bacterium]
MRSTGLFALAIVAVCVLFPARALEAAEGKNLQVLDKNISAMDLKKTMEAFSAQLGVKCAFCHLGEDYEKDDKKQKNDARKMIKLVMEMKGRKNEFFKTTVKENAIGCALCHRGKPQPEPFIP